MLASNISTSPFCDATFKSETVLSHLSFKGNLSSLLSKIFSSLGVFTYTLVVAVAPFVSRNVLERSTIFFPLQVICSLFSSTTFATMLVSRFSSSAYLQNSSTDLGSSTTAILSCDSEIASSVPSSPAYFLGTLSRSIISPSASSPIATDTPPAPKSLHFFISFVTSGLLKSLCIFLSVGALPFCTSAPAVTMESVLCTLLEPVAPPIPSLPVLPPRSTMISPGSEVFLITFSLFAAPITAPISILFAT